jgi:hypothetical protein
METKELGIAVVGSGRIRSLRTQMSAGHPTVKFLAVSDLSADRAAALAERTGADFSSADNLAVISHPRVNAVIVSTSEHEHLEPVMQALELGKPVLVEKPIALTLANAGKIIAKIWVITGGRWRMNRACGSTTCRATALAQRPLRARRVRPWKLRSPSRNRRASARPYDLVRKACLACVALPATSMARANVRLTREAP